MKLTQKSKIALVYDRIVKWGGAERLLLALHQIWPQADWYTLVYDREKTPWANEFNITSSFLQAIPLAKSHHEVLAPFASFAFEQFDLKKYDLVISVTSAEAKAVITLPSTPHVCICLTPTRYLWSHFKLYQQSLGWGPLQFFLKKLLSSLKRTDFILSARPDHYLAISKTVKHRIKKYYHRKSQVIYPPVADIFFDPQAISKSSRHYSTKISSKFPDGYLLAVSRLVSYKQLDIAINSCQALQLPLVIVGQGRDEKRLKKLAGPTTQFIPHLTVEELVAYYHLSQALIHPAVEDYGYSIVESLLCGRPVIAPAKGSASEIIKEGITGFFYDGTETDLTRLLREKLVSIKKTKIRTADVPSQTRRGFKKQLLTYLSKI